MRRIYPVPSRGATAAVPLRMNTLMEPGRIPESSTLDPMKQPQYRPVRSKQEETEAWHAQRIVYRTRPNPFKYLLHPKLLELRVMTSENNDGFHKL